MANILVVEDNEIMALSIQKLFERNGFTASIAKDGMEAMEKLMDAKFDLVITDLTMPHVTGFQLIEAIKRNEYNDIKIIVVTSSTNESVISETFALGADDYITKPFNVKDLMTRVQKLLPR
jgi:DNA-binding response OmpR family regulator